MSYNDLPAWPMWERATFDGQMIVDGTEETKSLSAQQSERVARVKAAADRTKRLKAWITFLRHPSDRGLGDTAQRLATQAGKRAIAADLERVMTMCGCNSVEAVDKLNAEYPYEPPA